MPEARSWPHRGSRLSALMMLSPDRIAFVKPFFELFITFSPIRSVHILLGPVLAGAGKIHRDVTPVARSARPPAAPDRPGQS